MEVDEAYLVGEHHHSFRCGEPAKIIGVRFVKPLDAEWRFCYLIEFPDGVIDHAPVSDVEKGFYSIVRGR